MFLKAAEVARRERLPDQLARAAFGYGGRYMWTRAGADPHLVPLLEDALAGLHEGHSPIRVRLMGRLACARRSDPDREWGAALSQEAVEMARRLGDASTLAWALEAHYGAHWWFENPRQRLDLAAELADVARESQDEERIAQAHQADSPRSWSSAIPEAEASVAAAARVANKIRQPSQQWLPAAASAMLALFRGELGAAEELTREALRLGELSLPPRRISASAPTPPGYARSKVASTARPRDAPDVEGGVVVSNAPVLPRRAICRSRSQGRRKAGVRQLVANDFEALLPRDNSWLVSATIVADVCAYLDDGDCAGKLYDELLLVADLNVVGLAECARGSVARSLGVLATILGRHDEAEQHFEAALTANERMGGRPWSRVLSTSTRRCCSRGTRRVTTNVRTRSSLRRSRRRARSAW